MRRFGIFSHFQVPFLICLITLFSYACGGGGVSKEFSLTPDPPAATLPPGGTQKIQAMAAGSPAASVTWEVVEGPAGGSVDDQGYYTAPQEPGIYHVVAKSQVDPGTTAETTILVTSPISLSELAASPVIAGSSSDGIPAARATSRVSAPASSSHLVRALHLVVRGTKPEEIRTLILEAGKAYFNTLILQLGDGVRLSSMREMYRPDAWTIEEFLNVVHFAWANGLEVIPEVKLLTHQEKLFKNTRADLMFNTRTYDPRKEETYQAILPILDEIIQLIHPRAVHIGHDEVAGGAQLLPAEEPLPPELFLRDVERVYGYLAGQGVETWMWGDMLIAPEEFPAMLDRHLHGEGGYSALRGKIPGDIVICDWHYFDPQTDFPSSKAFADAGHRVLGATWKNARTTGNFSRYMAGMSSGGMGMIATTWFHVQRREWNIVEDIIKTSGDAFLNPQ